jgi:hypothetical protein
VRRIHSLHSNLLDWILLAGIVYAVSVIGFNSVSHADDFKNSESAISIQNLKLEIATSNTEQKVARSGCCSWHGGVCDCISGRVVCCDGTFSPSCTCHHDSNKDVLNLKE